MMDNEPMLNINQCAYCKYYNREKPLSCLSFDKIPVEILLNEFIHDKKHPEQKNDIVFEPITKESK